MSQGFDRSWVDAIRSILVDGRRVETRITLSSPQSWCCRDNNRGERRRGTEDGKGRPRLGTTWKWGTASWVNKHDERARLTRQGGATLARGNGPQRMYHPVLSLISAKFQLHSTRPTHPPTYLQLLGDGGAGVVVGTGPAARREPSVVLLLDVVPAVETVRQHPDPVVGHRPYDPALLEDDRRRPPEDVGEVGGVRPRPQRDDLVVVNPWWVLGS